MNIYTFKPYSLDYKKVFALEKQRIESVINESFLLQHIGSTSVEGLGGKGIIDLIIACDQEKIDDFVQSLLDLGYKHQQEGSTLDRLFFVFQNDMARYHLHLTFKDSPRWNEALFFRDYLKKYPSRAKEYENLKKKLLEEVKGDGKLYKKKKEPFIKKIIEIKNNSV